MVSMAFDNILDAKVIHNEDKCDSLPVVAPQSRGGGAFIVAMLCKVSGKEIIGKFARLFEFNLFVYLEVDPNIGG